MSAKTYGVEWKRGELAEAATRGAGLAFKVAGSAGIRRKRFTICRTFTGPLTRILLSSISGRVRAVACHGSGGGRSSRHRNTGRDTFPARHTREPGYWPPSRQANLSQLQFNTLLYYKQNPAAFVDKCSSIQEAARKFDWSIYSIEEWVDLINSARS